MTAGKESRGLRAKNECERNFWNRKTINILHGGRFTTTFVSPERVNLNCIIFSRDWRGVTSLWHICCIVIIAGSTEQRAKEFSE